MNDDATPAWPRSRAIAAGAAMVAMVGSVGPWAGVTSFFFGAYSVRGTDGDGVVTLVAGTVALVTIITRVHALAFIGFLVVAAVGIYDVVNVAEAVAEVDEEGVGVSVGWGLWLVAIAGVVGTIATFADARNE